MCWQIKSVNGVSISITDLQLAAELGKALLERNRELEAQIIHLQQINNEQNLEIEVHLILTLLLCTLWYVNYWVIEVHLRVYCLLALISCGMLLGGPFKS